MSFSLRWFTNVNKKQEICLTPIIHRQNKRGHDDGDELSLDQILLMITNQQRNEMHEHAANHKDEWEERRICLEAQREDHCMEFQLQQQMMTTMMMMMGGRAILQVQRGYNHNDKERKQNMRTETKRERRRNTKTLSTNHFILRGISVNFFNTL